MNTIFIFVGMLLLITSILDILNQEFSIYILIIFAIFAVILRIYTDNFNILDIISGISVGLFILLFSICTEGDLGDGDGYLLMITGIFLGGYENFELLMYGLFFSFLYSVYLLIKNRYIHTSFPFVPFLLLSFVLMRIIDIC